MDMIPEEKRQCFYITELMFKLDRQDKKNTTIRRSYSKANLATNRVESATSSPRTKLTTVKRLRESAARCQDRYNKAFEKHRTAYNDSVSRHLGHLLGQNDALT